MSELVAKSLDLNIFRDLTPAQESGTELKVTHPKTGGPLGIVMRVAGPDSKRQKAAVSEIIGERTDLRIRKVDGERLEEEFIRTAAASIISWSGVIENGKEIEYSADAAIDLLTRFPFIREQVTAISGDRANFLKK